MPSWLKTFNPAASTSKKEAPKAGSSSNVKKGDRKENPPAPPRNAAPPPAYATVAPRATPAESSRAIVRRDDYGGEKHGHPVSHHVQQDDSEDDFGDKMGKAMVRRGQRGGDDSDENKYGASRHRQEDYSEDDRDDRKGREIVRRGKSRRDPSESDSESDYAHRSKKKGKEVARRDKDPKKKNKKPKKRQESSSESDSDEQIVEKRQRFEAISFGELNQDYMLDLRKCFEVRVEKIDKWCDDGLIRMDTKDGSFNADKLLNSKKVEEDEKKKWAVFEKKYRRYIAENPGGDMHFIPRFNKYLPKGRSGPSVIVVPTSRQPTYRPSHESSRKPRQRRSYERFSSVCYVCINSGQFCGDPWHGDHYISEGESY